MGYRGRHIDPSLRIPPPKNGSLNFESDTVFASIATNEKGVSEVMGVRTTGLARRANKRPDPPPEPDAKSLNQIEDERVLRLFEEAGLIKKRGKNTAFLDLVNAVHELYTKE